MREAGGLLDGQDVFDHPPEVRIRRWLAVAGEGDVAHRADGLRDRPELGPFEERAAFRLPEDGDQLLLEPVLIHAPHGGRCRPIDLAVDAVEVADLVGVEVDAYGDAAGPAGQDRVHVEVLAVGPLVTGHRDHGAAWPFRFPAPAGSALPRVITIIGAVTAPPHAARALCPPLVAWYRRNRRDPPRRRRPDPSPACASDILSP